MDSSSENGFVSSFVYLLLIDVCSCICAVHNNVAAKSQSTVLHNAGDNGSCCGFADSVV
jgi:hypothetical protein